MRDDTELCKQFSNNDSFCRWLADTIFRLTYEAESPQPEASPLRFPAPSLQ
jgi:type I restriction enzyme R subunit